MASNTLTARIQIRNDTAANWTQQNPILLKGEIGIEIDSKKFKFGDGVSNWNDLQYASAQASVTMAKAPLPTDYSYDLGTMWVDTAAQKVYVIVDNTESAAVWQQMVTPDELSDLGAGDMLKSQFANNPKAGSGYVNAAIIADTASATTGTLTIGSVKFNGSQNQTVTAETLGAITEIPESYVENTDYGTSETGGVVKSSSGANKVKIESDGTMTMGKANSAVQADSANTASQLATGQTISVSGDATGTSAAFNGTSGVTIPISLSETGVGAGTYTKVTVDEKGRVTEGATLAESDIPNISYTKVTGLGTVAVLNTGTSAGNVPVLMSNGKLDTSVIPSLAITETFVVDSQAEMLELTAQVGDVCVRTDLEKTFILKQEPATTLANWVELLSPTESVSSVNGKTGAVTLTTSDINEGTNLYFTTARANANWVTHASTELTDSDTLLRTSDTFVINGGQANS